VTEGIVTVVIVTVVIVTVVIVRVVNVTVMIAIVVKVTVVLVTVVKVIVIVTVVKVIVVIVTAVIVTVVIVTVVIVTVAIEIVVIVTVVRRRKKIYIISQNFWIEQFDLFDNRCDVLRAAFCDSLDVFLYLFTPFKHLFAPNSRSPMSKLFISSESLGKRNGKKCSHI
jgi:nicotinic acetylcholine receptor alpha-3